ncbi:MAG: hypothetical protein ACRDGL_00765 [Candidatus Limnocylindrales bacterium]
MDAQVAGQLEREPGMTSWVRSREVSERHAAIVRIVVASIISLLTDAAYLYLTNDPATGGGPARRAFVAGSLLLVGAVGLVGAAATDRDISVAGPLLWAVSAAYVGWPAGDRIRRAASPPRWRLDILVRCP